MKEMQLTRGLVALVDDEDYEWLTQWSWHATNHLGKSYACRSGRAPAKRAIYMHRVILNAPASMHVDHINGNLLQNTRDNLRLATRAQNLANRGKTIVSQSGFKGVYRQLNRDKWLVQIKADGVVHHVGMFLDKEDGARAYDQAARIFHGPFAHLNFPEISS